MHPPDAPERQPGGCDNTPVLVVRAREEYFEARASLFVCLKDKTCPSTEGGQGDDGARCSAAGAFVALSRTYGLGPAFPGCLAACRSRAVGLGRCCAAQHPGTRLYFVQLRLGTVTEGIFSFVECRAVTGCPNLCPSTGLKLGARRSYK